MPLAADGPGYSCWNEAPIPSQGPSSGHILAEGTDILYLGREAGVLYAVIAGGRTSLFASDDGGHSWDELARLEDGFVDFQIAPGGEEMYYATTADVFHSADGGRSFFPLAPVDGTGTGGRRISSIDITAWQGAPLLAAGIVDENFGERGGVYLIQPDELFARWYDSGLKGQDVYRVAFMPCEAAEPCLAAVGLSRDGCRITTMAGNTGWGNFWAGGIVLDRGGQELVSLQGASLAFPEHFNAGTEAAFFIGIDSGASRGGLYHYDLRRSGAEFSVPSVDLSGREEIDIAAVGAGRENTVLAGTAGSNQVYLSTDGGVSWAEAVKKPTGNHLTDVLAAPSGYYAATGGVESGLSFSGEGRYWEQTSLVDTRVEALVDLAVAGDADATGDLYLLTWGGSASLWRRRGKTGEWARCFSSAPENVAGLEKVALSPEYDGRYATVYLAGTGPGGVYQIWRSADAGTSFTGRKAPARVDCWAVAGDDTLLIGGYDGTESRVYRSDTSGARYASETVGTAPLYSLSPAPDYAGSGRVLAGDTAGNVFISNPDGTGFESLGEPGFAGSVSVCFDSQYAQSGLVYAACSQPGSSIRRRSVGDGGGWQEFGGILPAESRIGNLEISSRGPVYASVYTSADYQAGAGGMLRVLYPQADEACQEIALKGLETGSTLWRIRAASEKAWAIDTTHNRLVYYTDSLLDPPELCSPGNGTGPAGIAGPDFTGGIELEWEALSGADRYHWQVSGSPSFTDVAASLEGFTTATRIALPLLSGGKGYYWRIRADRPVTSPWSEVFYFETALGTVIMAPVLESPGPGERGVELEPLFQWQKVEGAASYELLLGTDAAFEELVIERAGSRSLPANAWQASTELEPATGYFWKVRALDAGGPGDWSAVGTFRTRSRLTVENPPAEEEPPAGQDPLFATTVVLRPEITATIAPPEMPRQTIVISREPSSGYPPLDNSAPGWFYYVLAGAGAIVLMLVVILVVVVVKKPGGNY